MGGCAGISGPPRVTVRQTYQSKLRNPGKANKNMSPPKGSDSKTISTIDFRKQQSLAFGSMRATQNIRGSLLSPILIKDRSQKQNLLLSDNRKNESLRETHSRLQGNGNDELSRIESRLERSRQKSPQSYTQMMMQQAGDRQHNYQRTTSYIDSFPHSQTISSTNGLSLKKRCDLDIIQQLMNEEAKTPQYISAMRQQHGEDIEDIQIHVNGVLPPVTFEALHFYLKDLQCLKKEQLVEHVPGEGSK